MLVTLKITKTLNNLYQGHLQLDTSSMSQTQPLNPSNSLYQVILRKPSSRTVLFAWIPSISLKLMRLEKKNLTSRREKKCILCPLKFSTSNSLKYSNHYTTYYCPSRFRSRSKISPRTRKKVVSYVSGKLGSREKSNERIQ